MYSCDKCGAELCRKERFIDKTFNFCYDCSEEKNDVVWDWIIGFDDIWVRPNGVGITHCLKCGKDLMDNYDTIVFNDEYKPRICNSCNIDRLNTIKEWINE